MNVQHGHHVMEIFTTKLPRARPGHGVSASSLLPDLWQEWRARHGCRASACLRTSSRVPQALLGMHSGRDLG
jgi:hypothetical protein